MTESVSASDPIVPNRPAGRVHIGERLRRHVEDVLARYVARMRADSVLPLAKDLPAPLLEDHAMSFLGDLFQSLVVLEENEKLKDRDESEMLGDGSRIQGLISELHGRQRRRIGWTERALEREYEILKEEVASTIRRYAADAEGVGGVAWAIETAGRLLAKSHEGSVRGYRAG